MQSSQTAMECFIYTLSAVNDPQTVNTLVVGVSNLLNCSAHFKSSARDLKPDVDWMSLKSGPPLISDAMGKMRPSSSSPRSLCRRSWECLFFLVSSQGRQPFVTLHVCVFLFSNKHLSRRSFSVSPASSTYWPTEP